MSTMEDKKEEVPKNKRYRKDKPWDDPSIDHWKLQQLKPQQVSGSFLQESSFSVLFPQYREKYIQQIHGVVKKRLMQFGVKLQLNLLEGSLTVRTTKKTWDPYSIIKARDVIKLISRSVPYQQALRVMEDGTFSQVIKIRSYVRNKERFIKRRQRLIGPNGDTLKALQLLTNCYVLVQGSTVCLIGQFKQLKILQRIVIDTMQNIHPVYHIKELMIKRQLMKDEKMQNENWDRFLPKFKQVKMQKKKKVLKKPKQYETYPPQQQQRVQDKLMETGQYFLSQTQKKERALDIKKKKQEQKRLQKQMQMQQVDEDEELKKEMQRQKEKQLTKKSKNKKQATVDELKQKFLSKPIKAVSF